MRVYTISVFQPVRPGLEAEPGFLYRLTAFG
jgi:hypothetical protein